MSDYWEKRLRDIEIRKLAKELSIDELAKRFGISKRTIQRAVKAYK